MTSTASHRAVGYVRLSVHAGDDDPSTSPERQREAIQAYCAAHGWDLVRIVEDLDVSGSSRGKRLARPGLTQALDLVESREADRLIVLRIDRLARDTEDFLAINRRVTANGGALVSVRDNLDMGTATGKAFGTILSAFGALEADQVSERVKDSHKHMRTSGRWGGQRLPYGYCVVANPDGPGKVIAVDPEAQADILATAEAVANGATLYSVAKRWSATRGVKINTNQVRRTLAGDMPAGRTAVPGLYNDDPALLGRLLAALEGLTRAARPRRSHHLLSGLLRCSTCGSGLTIGSTTVASGRVPTYACVKPYCERRTGVILAAAEAVIADHFLTTFGSLRRLRSTTEATRDVQNEDAIRRTMRDITESMLAPGADVVALTDRLQVLKAALAEAEAQPAVVTSVRTLSPNTYSQEWEAASTPERAAMLRSVIASIRLRPAGRRGRTTVTLDRFEITLVDGLTLDDDGRVFIDDAANFIRWGAGPADADADADE